MFVSAKIIFTNETFVGCNDEFSPINCDNLTISPRTAWLVRKPDGELEYSIEFENPNDGGALKGVWIDRNGQGMLVDGEVQDFVSKCNECCGESPQVTPIYNGTFPDVVTPPAIEYTVTRVDLGTPTAINKFALDYQKWIIPDSLYISSRNVGTSTTTYKFKSYTGSVPAQKFETTTDGVTEAPLVFTSNVPGALAAGAHYHVEVFADGNRLGTGKDGAADAALSTLVTALDGDAIFSAKGDYALATDKITLSSTNVTSANIVVTKVGP